MTTAIRLTGRIGRHDLINGTYEPMQIQHNNLPCWVSRRVQPCYLFHSGKGRWVLSDKIDDGRTCWAYVQAPPTCSDPSQAQGPWQCIDEDNAWKPDLKIQVTTAPASNDKFVQLRMTLDAEMRQYGLIDSSNLKSLWRRLDFNGNNVVSLAEIDKLVVEMVAGKQWPEWLNNKPALMRAYKKTILVDGDGDDWVEKKEFHALLLNIFWFNKLWKVFSVIDTDADRRINFGEFQAGMRSLGLNLSDAEATEEFREMDLDGGGKVLFAEFCAYIRKRVNPDAQPHFDADIYSAMHCGKTMRKHHGHKATNDHFITQKCLKDYDDLEAKIKRIMQDDKKIIRLWRRLDFNGNNLVSLAEVDKLAVERFELLNHKPALLRAYKTTVAGGNKDEWVNKNEFKALLANMFYFNKIYWIFDQVDGTDRRLDFQEFTRCVTMAGVKMSEAEARREFQSADRRGAGVLMFDDFCAWYANKSCPEAMTGLMCEVGTSRVFG